MSKVLVKEPPQTSSYSQPLSEPLAPVVLDAVKPAESLSLPARIMYGVNVAFVMVIPVAGAVLAIALAFLGRTQGVHVALFAVGFVLTGFGITIGYHRLETHRSFETHPLVKAV